MSLATRSNVADFLHRHSLPYVRRFEKPSRRSSHAAVGGKALCELPLGTAIVGRVDPRSADRLERLRPGGVVALDREPRQPADLLDAVALYLRRARHALGDMARDRVAVQQRRVAIHGRGAEEAGSGFPDGSDGTRTRDLRRDSEPCRGRITQECGLEGGDDYHSDGSMRVVWYPFGTRP